MQGWVRWTSSRDRRRRWWSTRWPHPRLVDAPHGMEFLYSLNRLNVATSRARCVCVLVGCPELFTPECRTPRQMQLANTFCRYRELATDVTL